jgi:microcompartment protein CcmL/EutN
MKTYALGMIETVGLTSLIPALDEAVKAADVQVIKYEKADAGIVTGYLVGNVSSVKAAVENGVRVAKQLGGYLSSKVIAKPDESIFSLLKMIHLFKNEKKEIFQRMTLKELQKMAKNISTFPITGRELHKLKKAELIEVMLEAVGDRNEA